MTDDIMQMQEDIARAAGVGTTPPDAFDALFAASRTGLPQTGGPYTPLAEDTDRG
jgi:hypothetical protein